MKNFTVYRSSAGSGKTYTLVSEYLKIVLANPEKFRNILAITFTNKAANEMKERILNLLGRLSQAQEWQGDEKTTRLAAQISEDTGLNPEQIADNAEKTLSLVLHHYSDFAISTIDSFMARIIRTFAHDLNIPLNFEVEIEEKNLVSQAIDLMISRIGSDDALTRALVGFAENKAEEEKSWQIEKDLLDFAMSLLRDDSAAYLQKLRKYSPDHLLGIHGKVLGLIREFENAVSAMAEEALQVIRSKGLEKSDFYGGQNGLMNYFEKLAVCDFSKPEPNKYHYLSVTEGKWSSGAASFQAKSLLSEISGILAGLFQRIRDYMEDRYSAYVVCKLLQPNIFPMTVLSETEKVIGEIKSLNDLLMISEFNRKISEVVMKEPVPFIYERLGERFNHIMVDEFQDTSVLQWQNLLPLIDNSLAEGHMNLVVGDGKQAIYRFRNGEVEQFAKLPEIYQMHDPSAAHIQEALKRNYRSVTLGKNYRSAPGIVNFNNDFFRFLAERIPDSYRQIYDDLEQDIDPGKQGGYISMEFLPKEKAVAGTPDNFMLKVHEMVCDLLGKGWQKKDIAILCRKNREASRIAGYLLEQGIEVLSAESLLLKNSPLVNFMTGFLSLMQKPDDAVLAAGLLHFLSATRRITPRSLDSCLRLVQERADNQQISQADGLVSFLEKEGIVFDLNALEKLTLYDLCEEIIRTFQLHIPADPFLQFFLDAVVKFASRNCAGIKGFLEWWEQKQDDLSIIVPEGLDAVSVMTIHKAKGLEFPVVIFPYANERHEITRKYFWVDLRELDLPELDAALLTKSDKMLGTRYCTHYTAEFEKSFLDLANLLYVVMTRPVERLCILMSEPPGNRKEMKDLPSLFAAYLERKNLYSAEKGFYEFGENVRPVEHAAGSGGDLSLDRLVSADWRKRIQLRCKAPEVWDTGNPEKNREWGNLIHLVLSLISDVADLGRVIGRLCNDGIIDAAEAQKLRLRMEELLASESVRPFFRKGLEVRNEQEIIGEGGFSYRPDRLVFSGDRVSVIDFKTGKPKEAHRQQVRNYGRLLKQMGYAGVDQYLLYIDQEAGLVEVS